MKFLVLALAAAAALSTSPVQAQVSPRARRPTRVDNGQAQLTPTMAPDQVAPAPAAPQPQAPAAPGPQQPSAAPANAAPQPNPTAGKPSAAVPMPASQVMIGPPVPPAPPTLEQMPPTTPQVVYRNGLLSITAQNSTLRDILNAVRSQTGATLDLPTGVNERVVTTLGPGAPKDVLNSLLQGSKYDYILLGSLQDPAGVERLILTPRTAAGAQTAANGAAPGQPNPAAAPQPAVEEDDSADTSPEEPQPNTAIPAEAPPQPPQQPGIQPELQQQLNPANQQQLNQQLNQGQPNQGAPGQQGPKTPEQLLQELQRMQQLQQRQQQQQQNQPH